MHLIFSKIKKNKEIMHKQKHLIWTKILRFGLKYFFVNFLVHIYLFKKALRIIFPFASPYITGQGDIVHELIPIFGSPYGKKHNMHFYQPQGVYFLEKYDEMDFAKLRYFTDQNGPKGRPHENEFWLFSNTKMNVTNS